MVRDTVKATTSRQPRKQRKARILAPKNRRRKMMASPLSRELRERNEFYPRRLTVRKGDVVIVTRGGFGGHEGKVLDVDLKSMKVTVDGVVYQKADNTSIPKPIDPSNIEIIKLDLSDRRRKKKFERIIEQSGLSEEEIKEAEEELDATESLTIASYEEEEEAEEGEDEDAKDGEDEVEEDDEDEVVKDGEDESVEDDKDTDEEEKVSDKVGEADMDKPIDEETGDVKEEASDDVITPPEVNETTDVPDKEGVADEPIAEDTPVEDAPSEDQEENKEGSN